MEEKIKCSVNLLIFCNNLTFTLEVMTKDKAK